MTTESYAKLSVLLSDEPEATYTVETRTGVFTATGYDLLRILHPSHVIVSVMKEVTL